MQRMWRADALGWLAAMAALSGSSCRPVEPKATLAVSDVETYFAVDKQVGEQLYVAGTIRFRLKNVGPEALDYVLATATFKRKGEEGRDWGTAFERVTAPGKPLLPGESIVYRLQSDTRYYSTGTPESMFAHPQFKDVVVKLFLRVGASSWGEFASQQVPRRIGTRELDTASPTASPALSPSPTPAHH